MNNDNNADIIKVNEPIYKTKSGIIVEQELDDIVYRKEYTLGEMNKTNLFHPFKDVILHKLLRNTLKVSNPNNKTYTRKNRQRIKVSGV